MPNSERRQPAATVPGLVVCAILVVALVAASHANSTHQATAASPTPDWGALEERLERLRRQWRVPGMAAGVALDGRVAWMKGFGFADLEARRPATPDTVFHLASLTKPFAAVVLLQLVEAGQLDLDAPAEQFGVRLEANGPIRVRHLLSHTSEGTPGEVFRYNGNRFGELDKVLAGASGLTFAQLVAMRVLDPLGLSNTSPNPYASAACAAANRDPQSFLERSAKGYAFDGTTPVEYPKHFVTAAGLVSTVGDVLRFSIALDRNELLKAHTTQLGWTPARTSRGKELPYALGWFVQRRSGVTILWHYGWDRANSSLLIKIPDHHAAFVLLGNSEALSRKFDLGRDENVTRSPFAREFLRVLGL